MGRVENLKDYNKVRIMLQEMDGNLDALIEKIEDDAVKKAAPKLRREGDIRTGAVIAAIAVIGVVGKKCYDSYKAHKEAIENEPVINAEVKEAIQACDKVAMKRSVEVLDSQDVKFGPLEESPYYGLVDGEL